MANFTPANGYELRNLQANTAARMWEQFECLCQKYSPLGCASVALASSMPHCILIAFLDPFPRHLGLGFGQFHPPELLRIAQFVLVGYGSSNVGATRVFVPKVQSTWVCKLGPSFQHAPLHIPRSLSKAPRSRIWPISPPPNCYELHNL